MHMKLTMSDAKRESTKERRERGNCESVTDGLRRRTQEERRAIGLEDGRRDLVGE